MKKNLVPILSKNIKFHPLNKKEYFIHQTEYDHRIKISSELYHFIILIDNEKDLQNIINEYNLNYNSNVTLDFSYEFLYNKLATFGIINNGEIKVRVSQKPSYLKLNFIVFNESIVSKFTKYLHFLFSSLALKIVLFFAFVVLMFCFSEYYFQIFNTRIPKSQWALFFLLSFIGVTFHEFGHASAAHHFGAKHGGIGGGFYLFMPVYFADVTDIWKLPKFQRITVNLAGMYFELIYVLFLIFFGYIFNIKILIIFGCIILLSTLRNLNPFIRSDGYWVLSDAIEKPNLMMHGFNKIKQIFNSKKAKWNKMDYFLLFYGLVCFSFILLFLYYVLIKNPNSIIYFPQNLIKFLQNLFLKDGFFSLAELGKLFIPLLFYYLVYGVLKNLFLKFISKKRLL